MTPEIVKFEETALHLTADGRHQWLAPDVDVAALYEVPRRALRDARSRHGDELVEGVHWVSTEFQTPGGPQRMMCWTRLGAITVGFFLKSQRAKQARGWAAQVALQRVTLGGDTLSQLAEGAGVLPRILSVLEAMEVRLRAVEGAASLSPGHSAPSGGVLPMPSAGDPFQHGDPWYAVHELVQRSAQAIVAVTGEPVGTTAMKLWSESKKRAGWSRIALRSIPLNQLPMLRGEIQRIVLRTKEDFPDLDLAAIGLGGLN